MNPKPALVAAHESMYRIFSPEPHKTTPTTFRTFGPLARFDQQARNSRGKPVDNPARGIIYAAPAFVTCVGERFGDAGSIIIDGSSAARLQLKSPLRLIDLRGSAATKVGTIQAISGITQRRTSQAWGRWLYEHPDLKHFDGLMFTASHSGLDSYAIWERAKRKLVSTPRQIFELGDDAIAPDVDFASVELNLPIL